MDAQSLYVHGVIESRSLSTSCVFVFDCSDDPPVTQFLGTNPFIPSSLKYRTEFSTFLTDRLQNPPFWESIALAEVHATLMAYIFLFLNASVTLPMSFMALIRPSSSPHTTRALAESVPASAGRAEV